MKIVRIFNNNIVSTVDDDNNEVIVKGSGVGFNKKTGDIIEERNIEKIFHVRDSNLTKYQQFFDNVPVKYFEISELILKKAEKTLGVSLHAQSILALADHIYHAVQREKDGKPLANLMLEEIRVLYNDEFEIAYWALGIIERDLMIRLSDDEAGYIALHIVNANSNLEVENTTNMLRFTRGILDLIKINLQLDLDAEDLNTSRLITHLKFLSLRIFNNESSMIEVFDDMYDMLIQKDYRFRKCLDQVVFFTKQEFNYEFSRSEEIYLMIHLLKIL